MSRGLLTNPIVQVTLALVVILVIATLTLASSISGALNILSINLLCVQTAEKLRKHLVSLNCYHSGRITRTHWANLGIEEDRRSIVLSELCAYIPSIFSIGV